MAWTDERVALLKELWDKGLSASQIAAQLAEGVTRNAVIGKAHRMGLSSRPSPVKSDRKKVKKPTQSRTEKKKETGKVSLLDLTERMCKWPLGHPGDDDFHFCGKESQPAMPYCAAHCAEAYQAQTPRRERRTNRGRISATPVK